MFPVGKFAASEACKSHHRPCAASYRVQSTLDEGPAGGGGVKAAGWQRLKPSLAERKQRHFPKAWDQNGAPHLVPPSMQRRRNEQGAVGGGGGRRMVGAVGGGAGPRSLVRLVRLVRLVLHRGGRHKQFGNCCFSFSWPSAKQEKSGRPSFVPDLGCPQARSARGRKTETEPGQSFAYHGKLPAGAPSVVGDGAVFEVFLGGEDARTNRWLFHFGCARKMDRLGQPSRASVMDDRHGHGSSVREKRSRGAPVSSNQRVAWQRPGPIANVGARQRRQEWGNRASCFEMTGRGRLRGRARRRMNTGRDAVGPVRSGHQSRVQTGGNPKVGLLWLLEEGRRWWRSAEDGGGEGPGWGKRTER